MKRLLLSSSLPFVAILLKSFQHFVNGGLEVLPGLNQGLVIDDLAHGKAVLSILNPPIENRIVMSETDFARKPKSYPKPVPVRKRRKRRTRTTFREYQKASAVMTFIDTATQTGSPSLILVINGTSVSGIDSSVVDLATSTNETVTVGNFTVPSNTSTPMPAPTDLVIDDVAFDFIEVVSNVTSYSLGALFPLTTDDGVPYLAGIQYIEAFKCQINLINSNRSILPRSFVTFLVENSQFSIPSTTRDAFQLDVRDTFMVIGPGTNEQISTVGYLYGPQNITFISYGAGAVNLANSTLYPSFFRTFPSDNFQARAMAETMTIFGWSFVAALFTNDAYGTSGQQAFLQQAGRNRIKVTCTNSINYNSTDGLRTFANCVASSDASVVLLWMDEFNAANALAFLYSNSTNNRLTFVASDRWARITNPREFNKTLARTGGLTFPLDYVNGTLGFIPQIGQLGQYRACVSQISPENTNYTEFISVWEEQFKCTVTKDDTIPPCPSNISQRTFECRCTNDERFEDLPADPLINYVMDAVLVALQALNSLLSPTQCSKLKYPSICNLTEFSTSDYVQALSLVSVTGLTGAIQFNQTKPNRRRANFDIYQYNNEAIPHQIGFWNITGPFLAKNLISFKTYPAYPTSVLKPDSTDIANGFWFVFVDILCIISIIICITVLVFFTMYYRSRVIRRTNLVWLYLIFIGVIMMLLSLIFWTFTQTTFWCTAKSVLIMLGFSLVIACIVVRTERIFRVLINSDHVSMVLSNKELLIVAGLVLIPEILLIIAYVIGSGQLPRPVITQSNVDNTYLFIQCTPKSVTYSNIVVAIYLIYNGILVILCTIVLLLSRHLQTAYNEAFFLFLILLDIIILAAIMIPLYYTVGQRKGSVLQQFLLRSLAIVFALIITIALISYPKVNALILHIKNKRARKKAEERGVGGANRYAALPTAEESEDISGESFTSISSTTKPRFISETYTHKSGGRSTGDTTLTGSGAASRVTSSSRTGTTMVRDGKSGSSSTLQRRSASGSKSATGLYTSSQ